MEEQRSEGGQCWGSRETETRLIAWGQGSGSYLGTGRPWKDLSREDSLCHGCHTFNIIHTNHLEDSLKSSF